MLIGLLCKPHSNHNPRSWLEATFFGVYCMITLILFSNRNKVNSEFYFLQEMWRNVVLATMVSQQQIIPWGKTDWTIQGHSKQRFSQEIGSKVLGVLLVSSLLRKRVFPRADWDSGQEPYEPCHQPGHWGHHRHQQPGSSCHRSNQCGKWLQRLTFDAIVKPEN